MKKLSCFILAMLLFITACGTSAEGEVKPEEEKKSDLEVAVEEALYDYHRDMYPETEADGLGFVILGQEAADGELKVYTLTMYGGFEEVDGAMCKTQGHASIPMVVVLEEKSLDTIKVLEPEDSERYVESALELFPEEYHERIFNIEMDDFTALSSMEADCISRYLEENDLEMVIKQ